MLVPAVFPSLQHRWFFDAPMPCKPEELPKFEESHEMNMKKRRHEQQQQQQQHGRQQRQRTDGEDGRDGWWQAGWRFGGLCVCAGSFAFEGVGGLSTDTVSCMCCLPATGCGAVWLQTVLGGHPCVCCKSFKLVWVK